ncbi:MAG: RelA/SpoT domain-containing protein [Phycisphaerae bacterium]|nr:RelA/SpoT domain-containing protein [Phycisphaerae bacterium]
MNRSGIEYHEISSRIKGFDSVLDKIQRKGITNPFEEIHDVVGLRVVCLFRSDLDRIEWVIANLFDIIRNDPSKDIFGYTGWHFTVKLKGASHIHTNPFEIQIRTISQDAWDSVSHYLFYKKNCNFEENSIEEETKRNFDALSGLFYVADTNFLYAKASLRR